MAIDLVRMRQHVRKPVGVPDDDPDLTNIEIDEYLNYSYWEIMDKFPFREKERTGQFETEAGERNYEIPPPVEAVRGIAIVRSTDNQHIPLDLMNARETELLYNEQSSARGIPEKYLLENCYVRFWPTPNAVYTVVLRKWTVLEDIKTSGIEIPRIWIEIVEFGAIYRAFLGLGDMARANAYKAHQVSLIDTTVPREQKEIVDVQMAGLEVVGRSYDI